MGASFASGDPLVERGVMTGADTLPRFGAPIAPGLPQGSLVMIEGGVERVIHLGSGYAPDRGSYALELVRGDSRLRQAIGEERLRP